MRRPTSFAGAVALVAAMLATGCGKKGNPLPPLRPTPAYVADLAARRVDGRIELTFTVPATSGDGSPLPLPARVDVFGQVAPADGVPPLAQQLVGDRTNMVGSVPVRPADETVQAGKDARPAPGDRAILVLPLAAPPAVTAYYAAVVTVGGGRGRQGELSPILSVPLVDEPAAPADITATFDESRITVRWQPSADGQSFRVLASDGASEALSEMLTASPIAEAEFTTPVEFGRVRCFAVRAVETMGAVSIEGPVTPPSCVTPLDRFPPPAPSGLQAVQEGGAMTLIWTGVTSADLAGYVVLRVEGDGARLQPLMRDPIGDTTFRDDAVTSGVTYAYAVVAIDRTGNPSEQSNRQVVTAR